MFFKENFSFGAQRYARIALKTPRSSQFSKAKKGQNRTFFRKKMADFWEIMGCFANNIGLWGFSFANPILKTSPLFETFSPP